MEAGLFNITSATTTTLIDFDAYGGDIDSIQISNNNSSNVVTISVYLHDGTTVNDAYFVKNSNGRNESRYKHNNKIK